MIMIELKRLALLGIDAEIARLQLRKKELLAEPVAQPKAVHWTQTDAGKKKMAAIQKKAWLTRGTKKAPTTTKAVRAQKAG